MPNPLRPSCPAFFRLTFAVLLFLLSLAATPQLSAQSTFASILGTVRDATGAVISGATVEATNIGTSAHRTLISDPAGNFSFPNLELGKYSLTITAPGFEKYSLPELVLTARESRRIDATLALGQDSQTVTVVEQLQNVITTESSNLAETKVGDELVELPVAIYSRSAGSTSPISTLTTESGVQTDDSGNLAVMGTTPALMSVTVDGISSVGVEFSGPVNEMFPSFNSIEEIRVSESNNNAEFSGVADITTVSKAGTNLFHGGIFENHENTVLNAGNPFGPKPKIIMNDFGGTLGGPIVIPHLYNGHDRSFFFASYEGLRLPRETPFVASVPSLAMRQGNVADYLFNAYCQPQPTVQCPNGYSVYNPDGTLLTSTITSTPVPVSPIAANVLKYLFPIPNTGPADSYANNYTTNIPSPVSANQGDIRIDQNLSARQSIFARFSYKNRQVVTAPITNCGTSCGTSGDLLFGGFNTPEIDQGLTLAHNFQFSASLVNEFRAGYNAQHTSTTQSFTSQQILSQTGITVPQVNTAWSESPNIVITGFAPTGGSNPTRQRGQIIQALDNLSWNHRNHSFKFGVDFKRMTDHDDNAFGNYSSGWFVFDSSSPVGTTIGDPYTAFLQGFPDYTEASTVNKPTQQGLGYAYAFYAQDDWKATPNLTLNLGLRYELHPPLREVDGNTAFFLPDYSATVNGETINGAVVVPNQQALSANDPALEQSITPTPVLTAQQAHLPTALRFTDKTDWGPRVGFAWRPYGNDKTVLRGGWGRFIETPLGFSLVAGWAVNSSYTGYYPQAYQADGVTPALSLANAFPAPTLSDGVTPCPTSGTAICSTTGSAGYYYAFPIHYRDPSVQQWNFTVEQDLGHAIGLRLSYTGSHGKDLEEMVDLNQVAPNNIGYYNVSPAAPVDPSTNACIADGLGNQIADHRPYPCWSVVQSVANIGESNYNGLTAELSKHSGKGLQYDVSYMWTRDLSDEAGAIPTGFVGSGGNFLTDRNHPGLDYGNVEYDRRHRFLATWLYDLPFGKGNRWLTGGGATNLLLGGWELAGVAILQTGPFLTPSESTYDPANTNILSTVLAARPDQFAHVNPYATHRSTAQWLNPAAYSYTDLTQYAAGQPTGIGIGRFGNAPVGGITGPGTQNFSLSLNKTVKFTEHANFQLGLAAANVLNHRNYEPPSTAVDQASFGSITALQTAEGAGPRSLQLSGRLSF